MEFLLLKMLFEITIFLLIGIFFIGIVLFFMKDKNKYDIIILKAKESHNNRTLQFTKGKEYRFYKVGNGLMTNEDDLSKYRDNYFFCKQELLEYFESTNIYSKLILMTIK